MAIYLCHEQPDLYEHDAVVDDGRPGAVVLSRSAFHPGGGGQVERPRRDRVRRRSIAVTQSRSTATAGGTFSPIRRRSSTATSHVRVDAEHRLRVASLHTMSHVLNAFVFDEFEGSLVTGAQINGDGTGRMDFDLTAIDNDRLRALEAPVNDVIARALTSSRSMSTPTRPLPHPA